MKKSTPTTRIVNTITTLLLISAVVLAVCGTTHAQSDKTLFPRPPEIRKAVGFWTRVYSEVDSNTGFVHDNRALDVVYEVYPLATHASPKRQHRAIRKRVRHYQQLLRKIATTPEADLSQEEQRIKRLWGPNASPSQLRNAAERVRFQRGQSDRMDKGLKRAAAYEDRIRAILRDKGVPEQLAALPHVESSYNPNVRSKVGAAGLWQIMPATGRRYLRVNNVVDERLDPYKATTAAAQLLKHNYSVLKSWPLAITAYNHGLSGVRRAVRKTGTANIETIVQQYNGRAFKFASRNFYAAFLAAYDVSSSRRARHKEKATPNLPVITLNAYMPAEAIVAGLGIDEQRLKEHNPDLGATVWSGEKYIPKSYRLHIPIKRDLVRLQAEVTRLEKLSGHAQQVPDLFYRVERGDNLAEIAKRYDTSIKTLMAMNSLRSRHRINAGQVLRVPKPTPPAAVSVAALSSTKDANETVEPIPTVAPLEQTDPAPAPSSVIVQKSDIHPSSALENDTRMEITKDTPPDPSPGEDGSTIGENETVLVAQSDLAADPADYLVAEDGSIEVQVGETLGHYAHWLNLPTRRLRALNGVRHGQHLIIGQRLVLAFPNADTRAFEQKRKNFHAEIQNRFFKKHLIVDVRDHVLTNGDNLWELSTQTYQVPLWLLRQFNPDLAFDTVLSLSSSLRVPLVQLNDGNAVSLPRPETRSLPQTAGLVGHKRHSWMPANLPAP